jgi:cardiolipin synthase C
VSSRDNDDTRLGRSIESLLRSHSGLSGVLSLPDNRDAFAARMLLADAAERTIDAQYYIWHNDMAGALLFAALLRAADRGVCVRLLLDDNNTGGLDGVLATLNAHPNVQVRLFNPFRLRRWRLINFLTDFARLNRRMHNKSFTVDCAATIIGGRNIGDEYFDAGPGISFADLDVLAIGQVTNEVSQDFERYWISGSACPAELVLPFVDSALISEVTTSLLHAKTDPQANAYLLAIGNSRFTKILHADGLPFEWVEALMLSDDPAKALGRARDDALLWPRLKQFLEGSTQEVQLVSPYFVPGTAGVEFFRGLTQRGVQTTVLTNSLEATDVPAVHAGYAKRRTPLLRAGVKLFEMKRAFSSPPVKTHGPAGSSNASLHAKTFAVDRTRVFIGSFNFDPRSARHNTEMGFVIDSPALAEAIADAVARIASSRAYQLSFGDGGSLIWSEQQDGQELIHDQEPGTGFWRRTTVTVLSLLPIEWLL